ncbi:MAG: hypothetical protein JWR35_670 [Marmoricola sp.]|jgi:hypothetical protein|nr:hypothetical protein [Marmoricola sp.]
MRVGTLEFLADHRARRIEVLTDRLVDTIVEQNPGYKAAAVVPLSDLRLSCRDNISRVLELLGTSIDGAAPGDNDPRYDAAEETGHRRAAQGLPLDDVLRSFRIGGRLIWEDLIAEAQTLNALDADGLREVGTRLWEVVDKTSSQVAMAYHATERDHVRADEQRSAAMWEELLSGRAQEHAFAVVAAQTLGLPLQGPFVAAALSVAANDIESRLERRRIGSAWHRRTDSVVGVLALGQATLGEAMEILSAAGAARGGVSSVVPGLAAIDSAFTQASLALRTLTPGEAGVVAFDQRLVEALLLNSSDIAGRLVRVWLGPVLDLSEADGRVLLGTLRAWVDSGGSMTRTAELASCHRNTAINRIARVSALIGSHLGEGTVPVDLVLALRSLELDRLP